MNSDQSLLWDNNKSDESINFDNFLSIHDQAAQPSQHTSIQNTPIASSTYNSNDGLLLPSEYTQTSDLLSSFITGISNLEDDISTGSKAKKSRRRGTRGTYKQRGNSRFLTRPYCNSYERIVNPVPKVCINPEILRRLGYQVENFTNYYNTSHQPIETTKFDQTTQPYFGQKDSWNTLQLPNELIENILDPTEPESTNFDFNKYINSSGPIEGINEHQNSLGVQLSNDQLLDGFLSVTQASEPFINFPNSVLNAESLKFKID